VPVSRYKLCFSDNKKREFFTPAHETKNLCWGKDLILLDLNILHDFSVYPGCQFCLFTTVEQLWTDEHRSDRRKFIECFGIEKLPTVLRWKLEKPATEIVAYCVSQNT
jgi:hypothetical protein